MSEPFYGLWPLQETWHGYEPINQIINALPSLRNKSYRDLQKIAKYHGIPCNLKKDTLRQVIGARIAGKEDLERTILKKVKEERSIRRKQLKEVTTKCWANSLNVVKIEEAQISAETNNNTTQVKLQEFLLKKMSNESSSKGVTVCTTEVKAQYSTYKTVGSKSDNSPDLNPFTSQKILKPAAASSINNFAVSFPSPKLNQFAPQRILRPAIANFALSFPPPTQNQYPLQKMLMPAVTVTTDNFTATCALPTVNQSAPQRLLMPAIANLTDNLAVTCANPNLNQSAPQRMLLPAVSNSGGSVLKTLLSTTPIYSSRPMTSESTIVASSVSSRHYGDLPQQSSRTKNMLALPYLPAETNTQSNLFKDNNPYLQPEIPYGDVTPNDNYSSLPSFHTLPPPYDVDAATRMKSMPPLCNMIEQTSRTGNENSPLDYLAQMASLLEEDQGFVSASGSKPATFGSNNFSLNPSELIVGSTNSNSQDIPTWKTFLEQQHSSNVTLAKCKFGCPAVAENSQDIMAHEKTCQRQPIQCPSTTCCWVNQLGSLSTHIFNYHNGEVAITSEATFHLNFGNDLIYNAMVVGDLDDGPRRQTFYQLVNHRLFVTFVIGNFQSMQLYIYIQYVDDFLNMRSSGAIEVLRSDGLPYQWSGNILPISFNPLRLIPQRRCLIFNMNSFSRTPRFVIHVKIRNHESP